jgi:processive 1,2-diacylglycerol beta-glucosyltransferase
MPPRILVLSASVGAGHVRAAEAVALALRETVPDAHVENLDVLQLTNSVFRRLYSKSYLNLVNNAPHVLGYLYDVLDRPDKPGTRHGNLLGTLLQKLNLGKFIRLIQKQHWDLAINTHFLPAEIIASLRQDGRVHFPHVTVVTDFETHKMWVNQPTDHYFTASEEGRQYLHYWGIPPSDITLTGIPIHPVFSQPKDKVELRRKHGLDPNRPVVLQLAGGFGVGPIENLYRAILSVQTPLQVVVSAGKNDKARQGLQHVPVPERHSAQIVGFTTDMDEYMKMADLVVSKPGGLTTSETLAAGAVMVVINPIPGQETRNSDFLLENGAAVKSNAVAILAHKIESLLRDPARMAQLRAGVERIGRPRAAYDVVRKSLEFIGRRV